MYTPFHHDGTQLAVYPLTYISNKKSYPILYHLHKLTVSFSNPTRLLQKKVSLPFPIHFLCPYDTQSYKLQTLFIFHKSSHHTKLLCDPMLYFLYIMFNSSRNRPIMREDRFYSQEHAHWTNYAIIVF